MNLLNHAILELAIVMEVETPKNSSSKLNNILKKTVRSKFKKKSQLQTDYNGIKLVVIARLNSECQWIWFKYIMIINIVFSQITQRDAKRLKFVLLVKTQLKVIAEINQNFGNIHAIKLKLILKLKQIKGVNVK